MADRDRQLAAQETGKQRSLSPVTELECNVDECRYHDADSMFYVTVVDGARVGFLLGPYRNHQDAFDNVDRGRDLANETDPRAAFYSFGTSSIKRERQTVFGS